MLINVDAGSGLEAKFQAVCKTPNDANLFAAILQGGIMYRRFQESQSNSELATVLDGARIAPRGDRLEIRVALTDDQMNALIQSSTFAVRM